MSYLFRPYSQDQRLLLPPDMREWLPDGDLASFISDVVDALDLSAIYRAYERSDGRGQAAYHPALMVKLLLYGYCTGVPSSRKIEQATYRDVAFRVLAGDQHPDHDSIAAFRQRHLTALADLFRQVLRLCRKAGLAKLGHVALDGTKIKANASKHKAMSYARMGTAEDKLAAEVAEWMKQAAAADAAEDRQHGGDRRGDELPDWVATKERRLAKIREAKTALEAEAQAAARVEGEGADGEGPTKGSGKPRPPRGVPKDKAQRNFTDPESRIMKTKDGFIQGYNAQAAVDAEHQIIVACDLTNQGADCPQLLPVVDQIKANTEALPKQLSADAGYASDDNLEGLEERDIEGFVACGLERSSRIVPRWGPFRRLTFGGRTMGPSCPRRRVILRSPARSASVIDRSL